MIGQLVASFFAGMILANAIPHLTHGISGDPFPTPFAKPPGRGLSSPTVNVVWAFVNLVAGYLIFRVSGLSRDNISGTVLFFAGAAVISILLSINFAKKQST